ncbi:MAG: HAMP domain-containing histidine kinase [Candidatus Eremiobacteraeota bacterium]|nr:HAMP domain-containing histidine kinase [Candidatus Eremiobacteraeota bacterium]
MRTVIHEMRNQLAVAVANIEAFIDGKLEPTPKRLRAVQQALGELNVLLDDVQAAQSAAMSSAPQIVDICKIIANEVLAIEAIADAKALSFTVHQCHRTQPECETFFGDPNRIGQLVKNLLLNAVRYTPSGGGIVIDCFREPGTLALRVANDGPGILPADLPHIFKPGYRGSAKQDIVGTGMGLAVAKQIVEAHRGTITADSVEGLGASFTARFPDAKKLPQSCATCGVGAPANCGGCREPGLAILEETLHVC